MNALMALLQQAVIFLTGPFGPAFVTVAVAIVLFASMVHWAPRGAVFFTLFIGAAALSAAWLVRTFIGAGGGFA